MRANIPNTPFMDPETKRISAAWQGFFAAVAQWIRWGEGSPEGVETALVGTLYVNTLGGANTTIYAKESGNNTATGWIAK